MTRVRQAAALTLQAHCRRFRAVHQLKTAQRAILTIQSFCRVSKAKEEAAKLRQEQQIWHRLWSTLLLALPRISSSSSSNHHGTIILNKALLPSQKHKRAWIGHYWIVLFTLVAVVMAVWVPTEPPNHIPSIATPRSSTSSSMAKIIANDNDAVIENQGICKQQRMRMLSSSLL